NTRRRPIRSASVTPKMGITDATIRYPENTHVVHSCDASNVDLTWGSAGAMADCWKPYTMSASNKLATISHAGDRRVRIGEPAIPSSLSLPAPQRLPRERPHGRAPGWSIEWGDGLRHRVHTCPDPDRSRARASRRYPCDRSSSTAEPADLPFAACATNGDGHQTPECVRPGGRIR